MWTQPSKEFDIYKSSVEARIRYNAPSQALSTRMDSAKYGAQIDRQCTFKFAITSRYIDEITCEVVLSTFARSFLRVLIYGKEMQSIIEGLKSINLPKMGKSLLSIRIIQIRKLI